jgi:hypothetical protein
MFNNLHCPICGDYVTMAGPCEICIPRLSEEEKKTWEELQDLSEDELLAILGNYEEPIVEK